MQPAGLGVKVGPAVSTGNGMDFLIGRLSFTFGLTGAPKQAVLLKSPDQTNRMFVHTRFVLVEPPLFSFPSF